MKPSFHSIIKSDEEMRKLHGLNTIGVFFTLTTLIWMVFTYKYDPNDIFSELTLIFNFEWIVQIMFMLSLYFLAIDNDVDRKKPYQLAIQVMKERNIAVPEHLKILLILFPVTFCLNIIYYDDIIFWIIRNSVFIILIIAITNYITPRLEDRKMRYYPYAMITVELIRTISTTFTMYLALIGAISSEFGFFQLIISGIDIVALLLFAGVIYLENEYEKYTEFSQYQQDFEKSDFDYPPTSIVGYMASIPKDLARSKTHLNHSVTIFGIFGVFYYIIFTYIGNTGFDVELIIITGIIFILLGLLFYNISNARIKINDLMFNYSQVMNAFRKQNSELFDMLDDIDEEE